jgi:uncharacterized protein (DUF433 family)
MKGKPSTQEKPSAQSPYIAGHKAGQGQESAVSEEAGYWIAGTRVSLESVVRVFREGRSPETIAAECFPTLSLEQVYGAITYYLGHREEVDAYLAEAETAYERSRGQHEDREFAQQLREARRQGGHGETLGGTPAQP